MQVVASCLPIVREAPRSHIRRKDKDKKSG